MAKIPPVFHWVLIAAVLAAGLLLPRWIKSRSDTTAPEDSAQVEFRVPVRVETLAPARLEERLSATGSVMANERVEIVSEVSGKVEEILFKEGAPVSAGTVLVRLDTSTLEAERDRARFRHERLQRQEARQRKLMEDGLLSQEEYDFTVGELNVLSAELQLRNAQLEKATIRAPFQGVVGLRSVSLGDYVSSDTRVTTLQDINPVKVEFSVPEAYARELVVGNTIRFRVQGVDEPFEGTIYALEPYIDPQTRSLTLRARAANPDGLLLPGAFAEVELAVRQVEDALSVPSLAIVPELGGKKVYVLEDGRAEPRVVETGIRTEARVEITHGLEPGEKVIVSNIPRLARGVEVEVVDDRSGGSGS
jgi:membrane fusion protein (multidrug efflux system)